ncbi:MAG TPA: class II aldolase/adducin family protein [Streptosporangiaceae bacterium]
MTDLSQPPAGEPQDWREIVARSAHALCARGLTWGKDAGDSSLRDPDTGLIYILPKPSEHLKIPTWDVITAEHIAVVDIDGNTVGGNGVEPTVELLTHLRIYQNRPDVQAVVHSHGRWSRVYAALRQPIPALMIDSFLYTGAAPIECTVFGAIGSDEVAMSAVECMGEHGKAALLAAHGAVCVGSSMADALDVAEITEDMARIAILSTAAGTPVPLGLDDFIDRSTARRDLLARYDL